jgi:hypothetical protein
MLTKLESGSAFYSLEQRPESTRFTVKDQGSWACVQIA